jgi:ABC-type glutathione transport system ATPase component
LALPGSGLNGCFGCWPMPVHHSTRHSRSARTVRAAISSRPHHQAARRRLRGLRTSLGPITAVDSIDLETRPGEFFSMLGPSGSGKTSMPRMIAGFEQPTFGIVELGGHDVSRLAPSDRIPAHERASQSRMRVHQRQRVALAHAPVNQPTVPLSDEPLGALDPQTPKRDAERGSSNDSEMSTSPSCSSPTTRTRR